MRNPQAEQWDEQETGDYSRENGSRQGVLSPFRGGRSRNENGVGKRVISHWAKQQA